MFKHGSAGMEERQGSARRRSGKPQRGKFLRKVQLKGSHSQVNLQSVPEIGYSSRPAQSSDIHPGLQNIQQRIKNLVESTEPKVKQQQMFAN